MRRLQYVFLLVYIVLYIWVWKLLLDVGNLGYLKPYAFTWIASSFLCLLINKKKTFPFVAFLGGSILGPIGVVMLLFSKKDMRFLKDDEKDENFYKRMLPEMERQIGGLISRHARGFFWEKGDESTLQFYAECFKVRLELPLDFYFLLGDLKGTAVFLMEWERVLAKFNDEYYQKFGKKMSEIESLARKIREWQLTNGTRNFREHK